MMWLLRGREPEKGTRKRAATRPGVGDQEGHDPREDTF